jgi:hypothetical protein
MLERLHQAGLVARKDPFRWDASQVLVTVCTVSRLECLALKMHQALETLAVHQPQWLRQVALPHWYGHYSRQLAQRLLDSTQEPYRLITELKTDIAYLLKAVEDSEKRDLASLPEIQSLQQAWLQNTAQGAWRAEGCVSCVQEAQ